MFLWSCFWQARVCLKDVWSRRARELGRGAGGAWRRVRADTNPLRRRRALSSLCRAPNLAVQITSLV